MFTAIQLFFDVITMAIVNWLILFMVLWGGVFCSARSKVEKGAPDLSPEKVAGQIRKFYDSNLFKLPLRKQGHYALRVYRTTGNQDFLYPALNELYIAADRLNNFSKGIKITSYRHEIIKQEVELNYFLLGNDRVRRVLRKETAKKFSDHIYFAHLLLPELNRVNELGMQLKHENEKIKQAMMAFDFKPGFTEPDMIRAWSSSQSNHVYWLYNMGLGDYRGLYIDAFSRVFPNNKDAVLSDQQYFTKITGMTHLIIAASGYYQHPVTDESLSWITEYFDKNIDEILSRCGEGTIAEVGICMLLTGKKDSVVVEKTRRKIVSAYNHDMRMIPDSEGNKTLKLAQHRNILASILLDWKGSYFPGPYLYKIKRLSNYMPSVLEPEDDS